MPLTKDEILNADDCPLTEFDMTPFGWPGSVFISKLKGRDCARMVEIQGRAGGKKIDTHDLALLCSLYIRDAQGKRIFGDDDYKALSEKSFVALQAIMDKGNEVNGLNVDKIASAEKNSEATTSGDSATA